MLFSAIFGFMHNDVDFVTVRAFSETLITTILFKKISFDKVILT